MGRPKIKISREFVRRAYCEEGKSQEEIAVLVGCSTATISKRMKEWKISVTTPGIGQPLVVSEDYLRREYVEHDRSATDIADELGCSPQAIYPYLREFGIQTRSASVATAHAHRNGRFNGDETIRKRREQMAGENNPNWKGGDRVEYYGPNWKRQRRKVRRRDMYTCQECGMTEEAAGRQLDVHHLIPFREFGLERYAEANKLANLICYCNSCHMTIERNQG